MELSAALFEGITGFTIEETTTHSGLAGAAAARDTTDANTAATASATPRANVGASSGTTTSAVLTPAGATVKSDRRKHRRFVFGSRAAISPLRTGLDGLDKNAVIRDISAGGVSLLYSEALAIGDEFVIQFSGEFGWPARILCSVRRCEMGGVTGTSHIIGATFEVLIDACDDSVHIPTAAVMEQANAMQQTPCPGKSGLVLATPEEAFAEAAIKAEAPVESRKSFWKTIKNKLCKSSAA